MRKIILPLIILLFATASKAQYVTIPDTLFRNFLMTKYPTCFNASKQMDTTCNKIVTETAIDATNLNFKSISSIEYFDNLLNLNVSNNKITTIDKLPQKLVNLICNSNNLTLITNLPQSLKKLSSDGGGSSIKIGTLPSNLTYLKLANTHIVDSLPILPNLIDTLIVSYAGLNHFLPFPPNLKLLSIGYNFGLTTIPTLPSTLLDLECSMLSYLTKPPVLPNGLKYFNMWQSKNWNPNLINLPPSLLSFTCYDCSLPSLPILPNSLTYLNCGGNFMNNFPAALPANLQSLNMSSNNIKKLTNLPASLTYLDCQWCKLDSLPALPSNLSYLNCDTNRLLSLPQLPSSLSTLICSRNSNLTCLPKLPANLSSLKMDTSRIRCIPNKPPFCTIIDPMVSSNPVNMPICDATNNKNNCEAFPTIVGRIFYDNNKNGIKDNNEPNKIFSTINLSNGDYTFSDFNGNFALTVPDTGSYLITIPAPQFFDAIPSTINIKIKKYDSTIILPDIALQPNTVKDSLALFLTPINWAARPGFSYPYFLAYANLGTTNLSPTVNLNYDSTNLVYDSCSINLAVHSSPNLDVTINNFVPGSIASHIGYYRTKAIANIGDTIKASANITCPTFNFITDTQYAVVTGSFDPNDKDATPYLTPLQVKQGKIINYTIRFENVGNDTAFNIIIKDSISTLLQNNTLEVISSSHNCKTSIKNGVIYFGFKNIKLPNKGKNEIKSHGFVRFSIKPKTTLTLGTNIYNKAYIYFDYNAPIITNTAVTVVKNPVLPVRFTNYEVRFTNEKQVLNTWTTSSEINTSYFNIQRSVDGKSFETVGTVAAKGNGTYNFTDPFTISHSLFTIYYRLQIVDKDGSKTYSEIKQIRLNQLTDKQINVFPNPATTFVNIECKDAKQISITDYFGRKVYQSNIHRTSYTVQLTSFPKGLYLVKVITNRGEVKTEKLIIE